MAPGVPTALIRGDTVPILLSVSAIAAGVALAALVETNLWALRIAAAMAAAEDEHGTGC
jgi:hypothetical protein